MSNISNLNESSSKVVVNPSCTKSTAIYNKKSRTAYILLGLFLGNLGIHNFYAGYIGRAIAQLLISVITGFLVLPLIAVCIWVLVEIFVVKQDAHGVNFK